MSREEIIKKLGPNYEIVSAGPEGAMDGYFYEYNANQGLKQKQAEAILAKRKAIRPGVERTLEAF